MPAKAEGSTEILRPATALAERIEISLPPSSYMSFQVVPPSSEAWKVRAAAVQLAGMMMAERTLSPRLIAPEREAPLAIVTDPADLLRAINVVPPFRRIDRGRGEMPAPRGPDQTPSTPCVMPTRWPVAKPLWPRTWT